MPPVAKKFLVASLIYFILGLFAQTAAVFDVWLGFNPLPYTAVVATERILLLGWLTQLGLALIYACCSPPAHSNPESATGIPPATQGMVVFVLFNLGLPLTIIGQPGLAIFGGQWLGALAACGGLLQLFAGLLFVHNVWRAINN
jgi:hypothetical protein